MIMLSDHGIDEEAQYLKGKMVIKQLFAPRHNNYLVPCQSLEQTEVSGYGLMSQVLPFDSY